MHSPTGDGRARDLSGHGKKQTEKGILTSWRQKREGLVKTRKEIDQARHAHILEMVKGGTCHDTERNRPSEVHSRTGDGRGGICQDTDKIRPSRGHSPTGEPEEKAGSGYINSIREQGEGNNRNQRMEYRLENTD